MTTIQTDTPPPAIERGDLMYRTLPFHISIAAVRARNDGIPVEDFPPATDNWLADSVAMHRFLVERGAWQNYRDELAAGVFVMNCPPWCATRHLAVAEQDDAIVHQAQVWTYELSDGTELEISIRGYQFNDTDGLPAPQIHLSSGRDLEDSPLDNPDDAAALADGFTKAGRVLAELQQLMDEETR
jgi:hypothetical protein